MAIKTREHTTPPKATLPDPIDKEEARLLQRYGRAVLTDPEVARELTLKPSQLSIILRSTVRRRSCPAYSLLWDSRIKLGSHRVTPVRVVAQIVSGAVH